MISASHRFALPTGLLAALAAIPIWLHSTLAPTFEPCAGAASFFASEQIGRAVVTERGRAFRTRGPAYVDGRIEASLESVSLLRFRILRGFEPEDFLGPSLLRRFSGKHYREGPEELVHLDVGTEVLPVRWGEDLLGSDLRLRAHMVVRDRRPVENAFLDGLMGAIPQLWSGTRPHTLFVFVAVGRQHNAEAMREEVRTWLRDAWRQYDRMCSAS